jgi:flagellar biosynthetic protein FliQ
MAIAAAIKLAGPLLLVSMAIGLLIAIIQAATQIHEQTITFVPKLFLLAVTLIALGGFMMQTLIDLLMRAFELMIM